MKKILAIGGVPGTGKSTMMKDFMDQFDDLERVKPVQLVDCEYSKEGNIHILGKYDEGEVFSGTDRLSMAVQPAALEFVKSTETNVIFEGDRLFNGSFIRALMELKDVELKVILLTAPKAILKERYAERGSDQTEQFLQSRASKYDNLLMSFDLMDVIQERKNESFEDQTRILKEIQTFFGYMNCFC